MDALLDLAAVETTQAPIATQAWIAEAEGQNQEGLSRLGNVMVWTLPDGNHLWSEAGRSSLSLGGAIAAIKAWGFHQSAINWRSEALAQTEWTVTMVEGADRQISSIIGGKYARSLRNAPVVVLSGSNTLSPDGSRGNWLTLFTGKIKTWSQKSPFEWQFVLSPNDTPLLNSFPLWRVNLTDFPNAAAADLNKIIPLVYGTFNSQGISNSGALPTLSVDTVNRYYLVGRGHIAVTNAYSNGALIVSPTILYLTVNGYLCTVVQPAAAATITVDVAGLDTNGDGTGTAITNPARIIDHILTNFVFPALPWRSGPWLTVSPFDQTSLQTLAAQFDLRGIQGTYYTGLTSGTAPKGGEALSKWATSFRVFPFWGTNGLIKIADLNHSFWPVETLADPYVADLRMEEMEKSFALLYDVTAIRNSEQLQYCPQPASSKQQFTANFIDTTVEEAVVDQRLLDWSQGST